MPFHWLDHDERPLEQRYDPQTPGFQSWSRFIRALPQVELPELAGQTMAAHDGLLSIFWEFLDAIDAEMPITGSGKMPRGYPVVFVSHQRSDLAEAERIADLACRSGIDYWLDIHDPVLVLANRTVSPQDPRYPIIIAAIIEMALLNSSHLIAVHTVNSAASKWVPYELGRVRDRRIQSSNVGGWFHPAVHPTLCGDYVHLCRIALADEPRVTSWLAAWATGAPARPWPGNPTRPLPRPLP